MEEESFKEILETNRVEIVQRLQLDRTFLFDYLRSKAVFDCGDCELVHAEKTREQKAGKFLDIIQTKGENGYSHFIDAIQLLNPWLYEKITGEKSTARPNPIITEGRESFFLGRGGEGRLPDLDIMSSHLKRTISDLQDITIRYDSVLREKDQLEKRLDKASSDLQVEQRRVVELERQKSETESLLFETHSSAKKVGEGAVQHFHTMSRELNERNNYIIALQMKLLSAQEEVENLKNKLNETIHQQEGLLDRFKEVSKNYDFQRRESMQLSVKLENQKDNIQKAEELKVKFRQLQFANQKYKAEKEDAQKELNELKVWTEALKARYDIVEEDRRQTQESHESAVADCSNMRERTEEMEIKLTICKREMEDVKNRCKDLENAANTYRESRDLYQKAFKDASLEREQLRKEREDAMQRLAEVIHSRDEDMKKQMELCRQFEQGYEKTAEELQVVRDSLTRTELELEELKKTKLQRTPSDISENSFCSKENCMSDVGLNLNTSNLTEGKMKGAVDQEDGSSPTDSEGSFDWQTRRKTTNIIESVKKRVGMRRGPTSADGSSEEVTTARSTTQKSRSLDEKLERWVPEKKALSPEAQKSLSLDRTWHLFKTDLPYGALECMFASSMSSKASTKTWVPDVDTKTLLESSLAGSTLFGKASNTLEQPVENSQRLSPSEERSKRPVYKKSNSSPSSILNFVHKQESSPPEATATAVGEAKRPDSDKPVRHSFKEASQTPSYNTISSWPLRPHNLPMLDLKKEDESNREIAEALMSPSFDVPFRKRSGALNLTVIDRPRSSSVPASPVFTDVSGKRSSDAHSQ